MPTFIEKPRARKFIPTVDHLLVTLGVVALLGIMLGIYRHTRTPVLRPKPGRPFDFPVVAGEGTVVGSGMLFDRRVKLTFPAGTLRDTPNNRYLVAQAVANEVLALHVLLSSLTATDMVTNVPGVGEAVLVTRHPLTNGAFFVLPTARDGNIMAVDCWLGL